MVAPAFLSLPSISLQCKSGHLANRSGPRWCRISCTNLLIFDPFIAYGRFDGQGASAKSKFVVQRLEGGAPIQEIEVPPTYAWYGLKWTPDGRALTYIHNTTGNTMNIYMQPLAGGAAVQLTHFNSEPAGVLAYAWSRDGKKFAITRARYNDSDVVMFSGFR